MQETLKLSTGLTVRALKKIPRNRDGLVNRGLIKSWRKNECQRPGCEVVLFGPAPRVKRRRYCSKACGYACQGQTWIDNNAARLFGVPGQTWTPGPHSVSDRKWRDANPEKHRAARAATAAAKSPLSPYSLASRCESCQSDGPRLVGHHWSYLPEHRLETTTLCDQCHGYADSIRVRLDAAGVYPTDVLTIGRAWVAGEEIPTELALRLRRALAEPEADVLTMEEPEAIQCA